MAETSTSAAEPSAPANAPDDWRVRPLAAGRERIRKVFRYRVYPTAAQAERLRGWESALRFLWNIALEQSQMAHGLRCRGDYRLWPAADRCGQCPTCLANAACYAAGACAARRAAGAKKRDARCPECLARGCPSGGVRGDVRALRAALPWLDDVPWVACDEVLQNLDRAWQACYLIEGADAPRFKRKGREPSIQTSIRTSFRLEGGRLVFPKLGRLAIRLHRPVEGVAKTCALVREVDQWFAAINCEVEVATPAPSQLPAVGVDRGVARLVADSTGRLVENPRVLATFAKRLARAKRRLARTERGSGRRARAAERVAKIYRKVRRIRADGACGTHPLSRYYADRFGLVVVEKLNTSAMTRSARGTAEEPGSNVAQKSGLNRGILDAAWATFLGRLRYKLAWRGARLVEVPAAGTSQTCAQCGKVDPASRATRDLFVCVKCGYAADADLNAAQEILKRGQAALASAATATPKARVKLRSMKAGRGRRKATPGPQASDTAGGSPAVLPGEDT